MGPIIQFAPMSFDGSHRRGEIMVWAGLGRTQLLIKRDAAIGGALPPAPSAEHAWPLRSDELLRAAGYDPEAMRWRTETGRPWRISPTQMIAVLLCAALGPVLALATLAAIVRVVVILL